MDEEKINERELIDVKTERREDGIHMIEDWKMNIPVARFIRKKITEDKNNKFKECNKERDQLIEEAREICNIHKEEEDKHEE